jgi:ATP-dependent Clp protease protease subunit
MVTKKSGNKNAPVLSGGSNNSILKINGEVDEDIDLYDAGVFVFFNEVDADICREAVEWILEQNLKKKNDTLTLIVCSEGGSVNHGFALIDVMRGSRIPVRTVGTGLIASMGLLIFLSGAKGQRILTPNTVILSHQFSSYNDGKEHELLASQKHNNIVSDLIFNHYKKQTGLSEKQIKTRLLPASDVWMSAKEALEMGLCDQVKDL